MAALASGQWNYAVPLDENEDYARQQRSRVNSHGKEVRSTSRNNTWDMQSEPDANRSRGPSMRSGNATAGRKRSRNQLRDKSKQPDPVDDSAWIHRDKLVQIEIQEMAAAGIHVRQSRRSMSAGPGGDRPTSRSVSRSGARRTTNHDRPNDQVYDEDYGAASPSAEDSERGRKRVSTIHAADEEDRDLATPGTDYRTPFEEMPPDQQMYENYQHANRPNTSRIPISARSPVPVSPNMVSRDSPLPRSRAGSGAVGYDWDAMQSANRDRSYSASSQVLADDLDASRATRLDSSRQFSNDENSPPKPRVRGKGTPTPRKASNGTPRPGSSHQNKPRTGSASKQPTPTTGHRSRPSTSHNPPEGEAPWIASMYKPDPRLPPDQQILPTHMKRMMQEMWEKEGKTGTAYDRDLNLLNDIDLDKPMPPTPTMENSPPNNEPLHSSHVVEEPPPQLPEPTTSHNQPTPLSPTKSDIRSENGSIRHGASGGYKITPTIPSTPTILRSPVPSGLMTQTPRMPDLDEKEESKPKKGCCCVVM